MQHFENENENYIMQHFENENENYIMQHFENENENNNIAVKPIFLFVPVMFYLVQWHVYLL